MVSFMGSGFEFDEDNKRIRNLFHDLLNRGTEIKEGDLLGLTRLFICITVEGNVLQFRFYISKLLSNHVSSGDWSSMDPLDEIGPRLDLTIRRKQLASQDDYKRSISRKSYLTQKAHRNVELNNMGDKLGRVHVQQPDLKTLEIRKYSMLRHDSSHVVENCGGISKKGES